MASITALDSIVINASPQTVFDTVSNYEKMHEWYPGYHCKFLNGSKFEVGLQVAHEANKATKFIRRIDGIIPGEEIRESYIDGALIGKGRWRFKPVADDATEASFDCTVEARKWWIALAFKLQGAKGHKDVYAKVLQALKARCEQQN